MTRNTRAGFASDVSFAPRLAAAKGHPCALFYPRISPDLSPNLPGMRANIARARSRSCKSG
jgi:hypothetical protein